MDDIKFMISACRLFTIKGRPGMFYFSGYSRSFTGIEYCDMVHLYDNGMKPATNGPIEGFVDYMNRLSSSLVWITPYNK